MRNGERQPKPDLATENFDSSVVQMAWAYHQQIGAHHAKSNVPVAVAAFVAGACWAKQLLRSGEKGDQI